MSKTIINIEEVKQLNARRREINALDLQNIELHENGKKIELSPQIIEEWRFVGMGITDFVDLECHTEAGQEEFVKAGTALTA